MTKLNRISSKVENYINFHILSIWKNLLVTLTQILLSNFLFLFCELQEKED